MNLYKFKKIKKNLAFLTSFIICCFNLNAQITVSYLSVDDWVQKNFGGQGIILGNIKHKGNSKAIATFTSTPNVLKIPSGMLISTGEAASAIGPNDAFNISKDFSYTKDQDKDLRAFEKGDLYDVSFIEFDFVSFQNSINFEYQFASDEYPEYVGSSFNDIFGFFVSDEKTTKNIALIPEKNIPVSVNTINNVTNSSLFINNNVFVNDINKINTNSNKTTNGKINSGKLWYNLKNVLKKGGVNESIPNDNLIKTVYQDLYNNLQYDGITQKLTAQTFVEPYKKYRLKIVIADVADNFYDSAVFLESRSFTANKDTSQLEFKDYFDYNTVVDPNLILQGKKLKEILPSELKFYETNIYFDFDRAEIKSSEMGKLTKLMATYDKIKNYYKIEITGNTDNVGSLEFNYNLSKKRCVSVLNVLQKNIPNFKDTEIFFNSFTAPSSNNKTEIGRKLNRRVTLRFIKKNG